MGPAETDWRDTALGPQGWRRRRRHPLDFPTDGGWVYLGRGNINSVERHLPQIQKSVPFLTFGSIQIAHNGSISRADILKISFMDLRCAGSFAG